MKTKSLYLPSLFAMIVFLTSMAMLQTSNLQDIDPPQNNQTDESFQSGPDRYHEGRITIKLKKGLPEFECLEGTVETGLRSLDDKLSRFGVSKLKKRIRVNRALHRAGMPELWRIYTIEFPIKYNVHRVAGEFARDPNIEYAEPEPINILCEIPDDAMYDQLWHLPQIKASEAWDIHKGENGPEVVIGIVDDAIDWRHEDLVNNQWENLGEDADGDGHVIEYNGSEWIFDPDDENGVDDDGNGKVDDFVGWDYINENDEQDNDPTPNLPGQDHGTHCIGIANSVTNNAIDVASVAWNVKFIGAKVSNDNDIYFDYDPYEALVYLAEMGADVLTNSWSGPGFSESNMEICQYAQSLGSIIVAAASNDNDAVLHYPASYPGAISVAATTAWDQKASFSNYGVAIDVCSPGVNILSLKPNNSTQMMSGTSMATPLTASLIALMKSYYNTWTNEQIITQLVATADDIDSNNLALANQLGYGRINAFRALSETNATPQQELKLHFIGSYCTDADTNGIFSPGETISMDLSMCNYSIGLDPTPVTFTLSSESPHVNITNPEVNADVPSDEMFTLEDAFSFEISNSLDSTMVISFDITASAGIPIPLDSVWETKVLVNQKGVIVYNGIGTGYSYSGEYIADYLSEQWVDVFYTETFPMSLAGFDAAFLSMGNYGQSLSNGTYFSQSTSEIITEYLYGGGYLFIDCGSFFGLMEYSEYTNYEEMLSLFSLDTVITPMTSNNVDSLWGIDGSLAEGLVFNGSTQSPSWYIDIMVPNDDGQAMLEESDYGIVAAQGEGEFGQRTVCMSYAIALLESDSPGQNDLLLARIAEYFGLIDVGIEEPYSVQETLDMRVFPNPCTDHFNIVIHSNCNASTEFVLQDVRGSILMHRMIYTGTGQTSLTIDITEMPAGLYIASIRTKNNRIVQKLLKH